LTSSLRTVFYGDLFADMTASREHGLPPGVLGRENPMSDGMQSLLSNPFFLVRDVAHRFVIDV
jgi:hypothetical protein